MLFLLWRFETICLVYGHIGAIFSKHLEEKWSVDILCQSVRLSDDQLSDLFVCLTIPVGVYLSIELSLTNSFSLTICVCHTINRLLICIFWLCLQTYASFVYLCLITFFKDLSVTKVVVEVSSCYAVVVGFHPRHCRK